MEKKIKVWLSDIKQAIAEIEQFLPEKKIFQEFQKDLKSNRAIERNIEIIGDLSNISCPVVAVIINIFRLS